MDATVFAVGERFSNGQWEYEVLEIDGPYMLVRSDDGQTRKLEVETAARLWGELQTQAKRPARRKRAAERP
jgi:hypothetical protein